MSFKKMIFRATRGKAFSYFFNLRIEPGDRMVGNDDDLNKLIYIIAFEEGGFLKDRIQKICAACTNDPV